MLAFVDYALKLMKHAWRNGTAPTCTAEVPNFVEKHVHDNFILTAGVKSLPVHRHLLHVDKPTVLRKPPHTVHKVLKGDSGGGGATSMSSQTTTRRTKDRISSHPYKHAAAAIASARRTYDPSSDDGGGGGGDERNIGISSPSIPSLFGVAGVIGGPEFDPYQKYRHDIFPFKEHLAHEVNKLVLEKKKLDALLRKRAAATTRNLHDESTDEESSYGDGGSETTDMLLEDEDNDDEGMLSSSSALVDDDDDDDDDDDEDCDELL